MHVTFKCFIVECVIANRLTQNLPRRPQGLLNSDEESKEGANNNNNNGGPGSFGGAASSSRSQIPQSPNNRRVADNSKLLVQVSEMGGWNVEARCGSSNLLYCLAVKGRRRRELRESPGIGTIEVAGGELWLCKFLEHSTYAYLNFSPQRTRSGTRPRMRRTRNG